MELTKNFDPARQADPQFQVPRVGVACLIKNSDGKYLLGKRLSKLGTNTWSLPGGHLEFGEIAADCCARETLEETGLVVTSSKPICWNEKFIDDKHYITLYHECEVEDYSPKVMEPEKCEEWCWLSIMEIADLNLFEPKGLRAAIRTSMGL